MDWINIAVATGLVVLCLVAFGSPAFAAHWFAWLVIAVGVLLAVGALAAMFANAARHRNGH